MREESDFKGEDVLFERDSGHVCLNSTASQLLGASNSFAAAGEQLSNILNVGPPAICRLSRCSPVLMSSFVDMVARLMSDEVAVQRAWLKSVVDSASDRLELDLQSIDELLRAAEQGVRASTASTEMSWTPPFIPLVPG